MSLALASPAFAVTSTLSIEPDDFDAYVGEMNATAEPTPAQVVVTEDGGPVSADTFVAISSNDPSKLTVSGGGVTVPAGSTSAPIQYTAIDTGTVTLTATLGTLMKTATANVIPNTQPKMSVTPFNTVNKQVGTMQSLAANFSLPGGITPARVRWTVAGANAVGPTDVTANSPNESDFSYMGTNTGTDTITACYDPDNDSVCDNLKHATVTWVPASPTISTTASHGVVVGHPVHDTATLGSGSSPTGQITFRLFRPSDPSCSSLAAFRTTTPAAGNGTYISNSYTPTQPGTYRWRAAYSGDANNASAAGVCGAPGESVTVLKASPKLATTASASVAVGGKVHDTAKLSAGYNATGKITFRLYGPGDANCSKAPVFQTSRTVSSNGSYRSADFTPKAAGTYRWRASYSGDARNKAAGGACNAPGESVTVTRG